MTAKSLAPTARGLPADDRARAAPAPAPVRTAPALPVLALTEPLPGFPAYSEYALLEAVPGAADGAGLVYWLQSVDPDGPRS